MSVLENPQISVIVPVYNVQNFLEKCINSILSQTYKDFELLLIDDGSTDNSAVICKAAGALDGRIKYYYKENGGLSDARNFGLRHIHGKYVTFIDSDDWVEKSYLDYLYKSITAEDSDISTCIFMLCSEETTKPWKSLPETPVVVSGKDALVSLLYDDAINVSANGKLIRSTLFADIRFPVGRRFEDVGTTYKIIRDATTVAVGGASLYNYLMRPGSITHSGAVGVYDRLELAEQAYADLLGEDAEVNRAAESYLVFHMLSVLRSIDLNYPDQRKKGNSLRREALKHGRGVLGNARVPLRNKVALLALVFGLDVYKKVWEIYCAGTGRI